MAMTVVVGELLNEADTCRKFITPRIIAADWDATPCSFTEQKTSSLALLLKRRRNRKMRELNLENLAGYA